MILRRPRRIHRIRRPGAGRELARFAIRYYTSEKMAASARSMSLLGREPADWRRSQDVAIETLCAVLRQIKRLFAGGVNSGLPERYRAGRR